MAENEGDAPQENGQRGKHLVLAEESPFAHIEHPKKRAFLAAYRETCNVRLAADMAETSRSSVYRWRDHDPEFEEAFQLAREDAADILEAEAHRRAVEGVEKPVGWYMGEPGGTVREYSDTLLIFLLKGARPEKYRDRLDVRGAVLHLDQNQLSQLPDPLLARIAKGEDPATVLASVAEDVLGRLGSGEEAGASGEEAQEADYELVEEEGAGPQGHGVQAAE